MRVGAVITSSVLLIDQILNSRQSAKLVLKKYIRNNKYIGSKDKKLLYEITFSTLKKYHGLLDVCRDFQITIKTNVSLHF